MSSVKAIIPARTGSVRFPGKNVADLGGKPMIEWTIIAAKLSRLFDQIVVSTNDVRVRDIARKHSLIIVEQPEFAQGDENDPMLHVVRHAMQHQSQTYTMLLQPTSPLRTARHITEAWQLFQRAFPDDSLVSVDPSGKINGAIFLFTVGRIGRGATIYDEQSIRFAMEAAASIDIDTEADLERARAILK